MHRIAAALLLLLPPACLGHLTAPFVPTADNPVLVVTDANYESAVAFHKYVLLEFYAPWCGHCKLAPEFEAAAKALQSYSPQVVFAKCDATAEKTLSDQYGIKGYPTLKWIVDGKSEDYTGGEAGRLERWVRKDAPPCGSCRRPRPRLPSGTQPLPQSSISRGHDAGRFDAFDGRARNAARAARVGGADSGRRPDPRRGALRPRGVAHVAQVFDQAAAELAAAPSAASRRPLVVLYKSSDEPSSAVGRASRRPFMSGRSPTLCAWARSTRRALPGPPHRRRQQHRRAGSSLRGAGVGAPRVWSGGRLGVRGRRRLCPLRPPTSAFQAFGLTDPSSQFPAVRRGGGSGAASSAGTRRPQAFPSTTRRASRPFGPTDGTLGRHAQRGAADEAPTRRRASRRSSGGRRSV